VFFSIERKVSVKGISFLTLLKYVTDGCNKLLGGWK